MMFRTQFFNLVITSIFILFSIISASGQGWKVERSLEPSTSQLKTSNVVATKDGGCFLFTTKTSQSNPPEIQIIRYDKHGFQHWEETLDVFQDEAQLVDAKRTSDGGYITLFMVYKTDALNQSYTTFQVIKFDCFAKIIWEYEPVGAKRVIPKRIEGTLDGGFIVLVNGDKIYNDGNVSLFKLSRIGHKEWSHFEYGYPTKRVYSDLLEMEDSTIVVVGGQRDLNAPLNFYTGNFRTFDPLGNLQSDSINNSSLDYVSVEPYQNGFLIGTKDSKLIKTDANGQVISEKTYGLATFLDHKITPDNGVVFTGTLSNSNTKVIKVDSSGQVEWNYLYQELINFPTKIELSRNGMYILSGIRYDTNQATSRGDVIIKLNHNGLENNSIINGVIRYDTTLNCMADSFESGLEYMLVEAKGPNSFYTTSDVQGNYTFDVPPGNYEIRVIPPNSLWKVCSNNPTVLLTQDTTIHIDLPVQADYFCPQMVVNISTPFIRRCFDNTFYVNYSNQGTTDAQNAYLTVEFDPHLTVLSSTFPWSSNSGSLYTFQIGDVNFNTGGSFTVTTALDCDSTVLSQTHCVTAEIFPNTSCIPTNPTWDGSITYLEGECQTDSIEFTIKNTGIGDMSAPLDFYVVEDNIVMKNGLFQLIRSEEFKFKVPVTGVSTYQLFAEQAAGYFPPNYLPTIALEGCGATGGQPFTVGLMNQFNLNSPSEATSVICQQNIGSFDPNDKQASPAGYGLNHYIEQNIDIDYHIRFQNVGTDTAFNIVIRDTLSTHLDPTTIRPTLSSFPYSFEIEDNNVLIFTFSDIELVDSTTNEPGSHGFVTFTIAQQDSLPIGTMIYNSAAIFFDYNYPVITNTTFHEVGRDFLEFPANQITLKPTILLEGPYDQTAELMSDNLREDLLIPYQEPYSALPGYEFPDSTHIGLRITDSLLFKKTGPDAVVDWVFIEFRDPTNPAFILYSKPALLTRCGKIVDVDGFSPIGFNSMPIGEYQIVVRHRNHLPVILSTPIFLDFNPVYLDFTSGALTSTQYLLHNDKYALIAGDVNGDFRIDAADRSLGWNLRNLFGYRLVDTNLDGWSTAQDRSTIWNNRNIVINFQ